MQALDLLAMSVTSTVWLCASSNGAPLPHSRKVSSTSSAPAGTHNQKALSGHKPEHHEGSPHGTWTQAARQVLPSAAEAAWKLPSKAGTRMESGRPAQPAPMHFRCAMHTTAHQVSCTQNFLDLVQGRW